MAQLNDPVAGVELAGAILDQEKTRFTMDLDGKKFEVNKETFPNKTANTTTILINFLIFFLLSFN